MALLIQWTYTQWLKLFLVFKSIPDDVASSYFQCQISVISETSSSLCWEMSAVVFEQTLEDSEGEGSLACCSTWGSKELTWLSDWATIVISSKFCTSVMNNCRFFWLFLFIRFFVVPIRLYKTRGRISRLLHNGLSLTICCYIVRLKAYPQNTVCTE